jgi:deoxyribonuclease-2
MVPTSFAVLLLPLLVGTASGISCLDNDGKPVDWWFQYKMPGTYAFAYADPGTSLAKQAPLAMHPRAMNDTANPVALVRTLFSLAEHAAAARPYNGTAAGAPSYFLYNDEPDVGRASSSYGHSKGVVAAGGEARSGLWIVHSTPKFPASSGRAEWYFPESELKFGQTFLCLSLGSAAQLDAVGAQLQLTRPFVYHATNIFAAPGGSKPGPGGGTGGGEQQPGDAAAAAGYPELAKVLRGEWRAGTGVAQLNAQGSSSSVATTFTSLAKSKEWDGDLYEGLVAPHYRSGFLVESWIRGDRLGKYCPNARTKSSRHPYEVVDAKTMRVTLPTGQNRTWTETQDHAKWAVSLDSSYVVCVGDINRMSSQRKRGGGAVCFANKDLCFSLYNTITTSDTCGKGADDDDDSADADDDASNSTVAGARGNGRAALRGARVGAARPALAGGKAAKAFSDA